MQIITQINLKRTHTKNNNLDTKETTEVMPTEEEETTKMMTSILLEEQKPAMNPWNKMEELVWKEINSLIEKEAELQGKKEDIDLVVEKEKEETGAILVEPISNFTTNPQDQRVQVEEEVQLMKMDASIEDE